MIKREFLWWETARGAADAGWVETPCPLVRWWDHHVEPSHAADDVRW